MYTILGLPQRGSRPACDSRTLLMRLAKNTKNNVRVLRTKYYVLLQLLVKLSKVFVCQNRAVL
jgi:hypothetical protein